MNTTTLTMRAIKVKLEKDLLKVKLESDKLYQKYKKTETKENDYNNFKVFINSHRTWKNFYRWHFLKEDFHQIESNEFHWKLE